MLRLGIDGSTVPVKYLSNAQSVISRARVASPISSLEPKEVRLLAD